MKTHKMIDESNSYYDIACQPNLSFSIFRKADIKWKNVNCKRCLKLQKNRKNEKIFSIPSYGSGYYFTYWISNSGNLSRAYDRISVFWYCFYNILICMGTKPSIAGMRLFKC